MNFTFEEIKQIFSMNLKNRECIEIEFSVIGFTEYQTCCMGKMMDKKIKGTELFWFGLTPDGLQAFEYYSFDDMINATVFRGKSLKNIWNLVEIFSINGCNPEEVKNDYLK